MGIKRNQWKDAFFWILPLLFLVGFYFYPLSQVAGRVLAPARDAAGAGSANITIGLRAVGFSIYQALLSTFLTLLIGLPAAFMFGRYKFSGRFILRLLATLPFILPTVVVAAGFNALIGQSGWINLFLMRLFSLQQPPINIFGTLPAILLAHVFYNTSIIIRVVGTGWERLGSQMENAATMLGASPWRTFWHVTFPLLLPSILSAGLLVFLFDFTSFGVVLLMGGAKYATIEVEIYIQTMQLLNLKAAGVLSLIQLIFSMGITLLSQHIDSQSLTPILPITGDESLKRPRRLRERLFVVITVVVLVLLLVLPMLSLILRALTSTAGIAGSPRLEFTVRNFVQIFINERDSLFFVPPFAALKNSLIYALAATALALSFGMLIAVNVTKDDKIGRLMNALIMLPLGTSAVTLGLGYMLAFSASAASIRFFPILIPVAHALIALPFTVRILLPAIRSIPLSQHDAAVMLGISPQKLWWKIDLPIIKKPLITAAIYAFAISLGEFGATSFLARPEFPTMPVAIFRYLGLPGAENYGKAMAMSTILLVICTAGFVLIEDLQEIRREN